MGRNEMINLPPTSRDSHDYLPYSVDLVPVFTFGENDLYLQVPNPPGSKLRNFQVLVMSVYTVGDGTVLSIVD